MLQDIVNHSAKAQELYIQSNNSPKSPLVLSNILHNMIPKLPFIESLNLHGDSSGHSIYTPEFYNDIAHAPRLQTLSLTGQFGNDKYATVEPINSKVSTITIFESSFAAQLL